MTAIPVLTVFGSCRVYDPAKLLEEARSAKLNQQNIFGFVHNAREVLQQIGLLMGTTELPSRLRPFLNIPDSWKWQPRSTDTTLEFKFGRTDCYIVEISSIRLLRFKAMFLQLNRTRELLASSNAMQRDWWSSLLRQGTNDPATYPLADAPPLHRELVEQLSCSEQGEAGLYADVLAINELLPRPTLFVSHFNTTATGEPVPQRTVIVETLRKAEREAGISFWDPTELLQAIGPVYGMLDDAHYQPEFVGHVADALIAEVSGLLARTPVQRVLPDRYEFTLD